MKNPYSQWIFPRLLDRMMGGEPFTPYRQKLLQQAQGDVLEIGFGTGLNLPHYPPGAIASLTLVDPNPGMGRLAQSRLAQSPFPVTCHTLSSENLPLGDNQFDTVVSTWTLCSIPRVAQALGEIYRVLKPGGVFLFVEHGRSPDPGIYRWQQRLTPIQRILADGCHLDRDISALVQAQFPQGQWERTNEPSLPALGHTFYWGLARK
jgi:ubiquinone/menaquinone biosynthesis C-methylase UbiE